MILGKIKITQIKSSIGCLPKHKKTLRGLGLRHIRDTVEKYDSISIRGMIDKVNYMVIVEVINT